MNDLLAGSSLCFPFPAAFHSSLLTSNYNILRLTPRVIGVTSDPQNRPMQTGAIACGANTFFVRQPVCRLRRLRLVDLSFNMQTCVSAKLEIRRLR